MDAATAALAGYDTLRSLAIVRQTAKKLDQAELARQGDLFDRVIDAWIALVDIKEDNLDLRAEVDRLCEIPAVQGRPLEAR